jgi:hypothetical protein
MPLIDESTTNRRTLKEMDDLVMTAGPSNASVIESHVTSGTSGRKLAGKNATAIPTMIDVHHMLHSVTHTVVDARAHDAQSSNMDDGRFSLLGTITACVQPTNMCDQHTHKDVPIKTC